MPHTLEETYIRILCNIPDAWQENVHKLLQWLANSIRTLTLSELAEVLAIDLDAEAIDPVRRLPPDRMISGKLCST